MQPQIFRKVALDRLSSPEQLDQLMKVTSIRSWQMLAVVGLILSAGIIWSVFGTITTKVQGKGILIQENLRYVINASSGLLTHWKVSEGDMVTVGQTIATLSNPDHQSEMQIISPYAGRVAALKVQQNDYVVAGEPLLAVESTANASTRLKAVLYIPLDTSTQLVPGMETHVFPLGTRVQENGYLRGSIESVSAVPVTTQEVLRRTGNTILSDKLQIGDSLVEVIVALDLDQTGGQGYSWSLPQRLPKPLTPETLCSAEIVTSKQAPINLIFARPLTAPPANSQSATMPVTQTP